MVDIDRYRAWASRRTSAHTKRAYRRAIIRYETAGRDLAHLQELSPANRRSAIVALRSWATWQIRRRSRITGEELQEARRLRRLRIPNEWNVRPPAALGDVRDAALAPGQAGAVVRVLVMLGIRRGELQRAEYRDGRLTIVGKGGRPRSIEVHPGLEADLQEVVGLSGTTVYRRVREASEGRFSPHQLRHAHAVALRDGGVDLAAIAESLGHRSERITRAYAHELERLQQRVREIIRFSKGTAATHDATQAPPRPARVHL